MAPPYNLSQTVTGFIFVVYLVGTFSAALMGKLSDSLGKPKVLCMAISIMLIGSLVTLHMNLFIKLLGVAVFTFGFFGSHSVASSWVGKSAVLDKAQASSLYLMFYYLGSSTIGAVGGEFLKWHGWGGVVQLISCVLTVALFIGMMLYFPRRETVQRKACNKPENWTI